MFVVFGIRGVNRTRRPDNHVIGDMVHVVLWHAGQACSGLASEGQALCMVFSLIPTAEGGPAVWTDGRAEVVAL